MIVTMLIGLRPSDKQIPISVNVVDKSLAFLVFDWTLTVIPDLGVHLPVKPDGPVFL